MTQGPRKTARDFDPRLLEIFDGYVHGAISKRDFMRQASKFAAVGVTGAMLLEQLQPNYALAQQVAPDDPDIETATIEYDSPDGHGTIKGLMAKPAGATGPLPAVLVIHENRGLNPYIEDVVRRCAKAGYLALGPDGLTPLGGYPGTDEEGREMQRSLDGVKLMADFFAAFEFLRDHDDTTGKVGAVGFCYGGGVCNALAVAYPDLAASVPFYGRQPDAADVAAIQAPLMIHYAGLDERINAGWDAYSEALRANQKEFSVHFYPDVNHGFHNDTTPRYDAEAAALAWDRTLAHFEEHLRG
ncbi:YghX family hydrolase [Roseobacter sp. GAI101]|uniref:YghX family hydrolase n=1 Tax=Roseobacter sp. (strain GAI101) TaxID=391589 RepID=UPI000187176E|nr:YghX family hydrolase [Roseobacter sp. GAI101]EEB86450.1 carboxymethylenebutenolidase [Roseobacter sp. GAI101]